MKEIQVSKSGLMVDVHTKRIVDSGQDGHDEYTVFMAKNADADADDWLVWLEYNADPVYLGWVDLEGNSDFSDAETDLSDTEISIKFIEEQAKEIAEEIAVYQEMGGVEYQAECHNHETGCDVTMKFRLETEAYVSNGARHGLPYVEYTAESVAENGLTARLFWEVPADMEDVSNHDWNDITGVDFR